MSRVSDIIVVNHGTIFTFYPRSKAAQEWWAENVQEGPGLGRNYVVEHRYAPDIIAGLQRDGFVINGE
jgi:hypothetical protein